MIASIFHMFFYDPLYNGIVLLSSLLPWFDAGVIVVIFTILVRWILYPLSKKSVRTQALMRSTQAELEEIKKKYPNKQEQARKTMEFYKEKKINPFASMFLLLIQLPILIALYRIFYYHGLTNIRLDMLYSFIHAPTTISHTFLGFFDINSKNYVLAIITAVLQYFQAKIMMPAQPPKTSSGEKNFSDDLARSMNTQMKYVLPVMIGFAAYQGGVAIAIYFITSAIFTIAQEIFVRRQLVKEGVIKAEA
jgi:YidC/Oxa1 family membrane protein insertase